MSGQQARGDWEDRNLTGIWDATFILCVTGQPYHFGPFWPHLLITVRYRRLLGTYSACYIARCVGYLPMQFSSIAKTMFVSLYRIWWPSFGSWFFFDLGILFIRAKCTEGIGSVLLSYVLWAGTLRETRSNSQKIPADVRALMKKSSHGRTNYTLAGGIWLLPRSSTMDVFDCTFDRTWGNVRGAG